MAMRRVKGDDRIPRRPFKVLVVDVGGTNVKILVNGKRKPRKQKSGPSMTAREMVKAVQHLAADWSGQLADSRRIRAEGKVATALTQLEWKARQ